MLEVNPRASRTVPFVSKALGVPLAKIAAKLMVGSSLKELIKKYNLDIKDNHLAFTSYVSVKEAVLPWSR